MPKRFTALCLCHQTETAEENDVKVLCDRRVRSIDEFVLFEVHKCAVSLQHVVESCLSELYEYQVIELDLGPSQVGIMRIALFLLYPKLDVAFKVLVHLIFHHVLIDLLDAHVEPFQVVT